MLVDDWSKIAGMLLDDCRNIAAIFLGRFLSVVGSLGENCSNVHVLSEKNMEAELRFTKLQEERKQLMMRGLRGTQ